MIKINLGRFIDRQRKGVGVGKKKIDVIYFSGYRLDFSPTVVFDAHSLHMSDLHHSQLWFSRYCAYANKITHYTSVIILEFEYFNLCLKRANKHMQFFRQCFIKWLLKPSI